MTTTTKTTEWHFIDRKYGTRLNVPLVLYWEVCGDPISDDYLPDEISAEELLRMWARRYGKTYADGQVPVSWFVSAEQRVFDFAPWDRLSMEDGWSTFLTDYTWPVDDHGNRLRWADLPVEDKLWRPGRADKGGFIQEATGWKPSPMQDRVHWPTLLWSVGMAPLRPAERPAKVTSR